MEPRRPQLSKTLISMPHKPDLFSGFEGLCWLSPYGEWQPLILRTTPQQYSSAQKHIGQQGHRRKPNMLLNSCLDPCLEESGEIKSGFVFSPGLVLLQDFLRQLEMCCVV